MPVRKDPRRPSFDQPSTINHQLSAVMQTLLSFEQAQVDAELAAAEMARAARVAPRPQRPGPGRGQTQRGIRETIPPPRSRGSPTAATPAAMRSVASAGIRQAQAGPTATAAASLWFTLPIPMRLRRSAGGRRL